MPSRPAEWLVLAAVLAVATGCRQADLRPAELDTRNEQCRFCSMVVSSRFFAAQVVAPGEEARFFDDLGCLASWLKDNRLPPRAAVFVADHRTGDWVPAASAVYSRVQTLDTPMSSHLVAHVSEASRTEDPAAADGATLSAADAIGLETSTR
jgi:copper chaperone NosL